MKPDWSSPYDSLRRLLDDIHCHLPEELIQYRIASGFVWVESDSSEDTALIEYLGEGRFRLTVWNGRSGRAELAKLLGAPVLWSERHSKQSSKTPST